MKRSKFLFDEIVSFDNIRLAWLKARRGKTFSYSVIKFKKDINGNLDKIRQRLLSQNPRFGKYRQFTITDPKMRVISAASFEERIMHHAIMNVLESVFERQMIFHSYACRKNKGTHSAVLYAFSQCRKFPFVMKLDVRKYFDSINHKILRNMLRRIIKDLPVLKLLDAIIDSYSVSDCPKRGLPIGNLTSQFFANLYLSQLDHFILEKCSVQGFIRYMDDMLIFGNSKCELRLLLKTVEKFCSEKLELNLKEPVIEKTEKGIPFLGYRISEKSIRLLRSKEKEKRKKLKRLEFLYENGAIDSESVAVRMNAVCNCILM